MTLFYTGTDWVDIPPTIEIFEPPDDRYLSGYKVTDNVDGDVKIFGPRLKDLNVPFSLYGLPIPITFGVRRLTGNIIWARPLRESIKKNESGGKGGPTRQVTEYQYFATFAVAFGIPGNTDSTTRDIIRMWAQSALILDRRGYTAAKWRGLRYTFYKGTADQEPDPTIVAREGAANTPAYRDVMYIVFQDMPIDAFGNFIPSIGVEIGDATALQYAVRNIETPNGTGGQVADQGFADFARGEYYSVFSNGASSTIRTYNLASGEYLGETLANETGVGWSNNNGLTGPSRAELTHTLGLSNNFESLNYCPWLNLIIAKPDQLNTGEPLMLVDPTSGVPRYWIGTHIFSGIAFDPKFPGHDDLVKPFNGIIPQWRYAHPFRAYASYTPQTFIMVSTIYNDMVLLKIENERLDMIWWEAGIGSILCMAEGELRPNETDFYFTKNAQPLLYRMQIGAAATRVGTSTLGVGDYAVVYTADANIHALLYVSIDNSMILVKTNGRMEKVDLETNDRVWDIAIISYSTISSYRNHLHNIDNNTFAYTVDGLVYEIDLIYGTIVSWPEGDNMFYVHSAYSDSRNSSIVGIGTITSTGSPGSTTQSIDYAVASLLYNRIADSRMPLSDFILGMSLYAGFSPAEIYIDPSIDDVIDGAIITKLTSFKAVMSAICTAFRIEMFESAGTIKFTRRALGSGATTFAVTDAELLMQDGENLVQEQPTLQIRREEELSVPQEVSLRYIDKALGYQWNMQSARRSQFIETNTSDEQMSLELPFIMTADEAKMICTRILWQAWNSRVSYSFRVTQEFASVEPGDFGTLTSQSRQYNIRVAQVSYNTDFSINIQGVNAISDESLTVVADTGGGPDPGIPGPTISDIFVFDIPLLLPEHDRSYTGTSTPYYVYVGPISYEQSWAGGSGYSSKDGTLFSQIASNVDTGLVCIAKTIPDFDEGTWMEWNDAAELVVRAKQGDVDLLVNATALEVLGGANLAAWGVNGRWELIAYKTVTANGNGTYTLGGLLRGVRGTDYNMSNHLPGDYVVLLSTDLTDVVFANVGDADVDFIFKAVGFGLDLNEAAPRTVTFQAASALPLPPVGLVANRSIAAGTGDIVFTWNRRGRLQKPMISNEDNADLTPYETNDYKLTFYRWPHYDNWEFSGGRWVGEDTGADPDSFEVLVTGATTYTLTAATIRANDIYEFSAPDDPTNSGSAFSVHNAGYLISENAEANVQMADLGYNQFVGFRSIDVMIQQKTTIGNDSGYGPGRRMTILIRDT